MRRIDAVRVIGLEGGHVRCVARGLGEFAELIRGRDVELVEVKRSLTRGAIGQVIVALDSASSASGWGWGSCVSIPRSAPRRQHVSRRSVANLDDAQGRLDHLKAGLRELVEGA